VENKTPLVQAITIEKYIGGILAAFDLEGLGFADKNLLQLIRRQATDSRLETRDYEVAETRNEQMERKAAAHAQLNDLQDNILKASQIGVFTAIEVAQVSAMIDQLISDVE
jgi:hypothetical protein